MTNGAPTCLAKGKVEVRRVIKEVDLRLRWRFKTQENDIAFGIVLTESEGSEEILVSHVILPLSFPFLLGALIYFRRIYCPCVVMIPTNDWSRYYFTLSAQGD